MVDFSDLHLHSTYSNLDAFGTPAQIVKRAKNIGRTSIALTDHGSVSGFVQLKKACDEEKIKPIYGCEAYMVVSLDDMFKNNERNKAHITILAKNLQGYKNLLKIASLAYQKGFYYRPTIDTNILFNHQEGLIVLSGCWSGFIQRALKDNDIESAQKIASSFKQVFGDRYFLETQHFPLFQQTFERLQYLSQQLDLSIVLTCDPHYLEKNQAMIQEILHAIRDRRKFDEKQIINGAYQIPSDKLLNAVKKLYPSGDWEKLFETVCLIAEQCNVEMPMGGSPIYPYTEGKTSYDVLVDLCKKGIQQRALTLVPGFDKQVYNERLKKELKLIKEKNFSDYFLIVADAVNWAKNNNILVGPARGSSAASLVCYLTRITEINPIPHDLLFERFLDETRYDPPDIDIDFDDEQRDRVKDFLVQRYGVDKVCNVVTFAQFKGRNSLDEIGKVFSIPPGDINSVKKYLIERSGADMRANLTIEDTFNMSLEAQQVKEKYPDLQYAIALEGQLRHMSQHAAGVIVGDRSLDEIIALYERSGTILGSVEMKDSAYLGLLKIDILGITELSILKSVLNLIGWTIEDLYHLSLDDEQTMQGFREVDVEGIFQFAGDSTKSILRQLPNLNNFNQLVDCVTLSKPGPAHCLDGRTLIYDCDSNEIIPISKAYKRKISKTLSLYPDGSVKAQKIVKIFQNSASLPLFRVTCSNGRAVTVTSEHWFLTVKGWKMLKDLTAGDTLVATKKKIWNAGTHGLMPYWQSIANTNIESIIEMPARRTYDFQMEEFPNYLANGFVVHNSGSSTKYIAKARGEKASGFDWHPLLADITRSSNYQIIYQEQVLKIVKEIGQLSFTEANKIRNAMAKSEGESVFISFWESFRKGALANGLTNEQASRIWEDIKTMGRWSFNRSHAVSYALLAWWSMYMKRHYPLQFYFARLLRENDDVKKKRLLMEINKRKIIIKSPKLGVSNVNWQIDANNSLHAGLTEIFGIGNTVAQKLIDNKYLTREDFEKKKVRGITKRTLGYLEKAHAFTDDVDIDDYFQLNEYEILDKIAKNRTHLWDIKDWANTHPITVAGKFVEMNYKDIFEERRSRGQSIGNVKDPEVTKYAMLLLEDDTDRCLVNVDRYLFNKIGQKVWDAFHNESFVIINGIKVGGWRMVRAKEIQIIPKKA